ncbi:hypothetical protein JOM56_015449 [Amanita muscaria]
MRRAVARQTRLIYSHLFYTAPHSFNYTAPTYHHLQCWQFCHKAGVVCQHSRQRHMNGAIVTLALGIATPVIYKYVAHLSCFDLSSSLRNQDCNLPHICATPRRIYPPNSLHLHLLSRPPLPAGNRTMSKCPNASTAQIPNMDFLPFRRPSLILGSHKLNHLKSKHTRIIITLGLPELQDQVVSSVHQHTVTSWRTTGQLPSV